MKKLIVLLSIVTFLLTGCSVVMLDSTNLSKNVKTLLSEKTKMYNVYFDGYKYYVPKGLKFLSKEEYNAAFVDKAKNKYYLYVDAISYYHKVENNYEVEKNTHYSKRLDYNKKTGYIQIDEIDNKYHIQFVFNYAKMEAYVSESDLVSVVNNMCYILRTVKFNDEVLESLIGDNILSYKEEDFTLFKTDSSKEDFLDVVSKYEDDAYKKAVDSDEIDLDD